MVRISAQLYMNAVPVTKRSWTVLRAAARSFGYTDLPSGGNEGQQPVGNVNWYEAVKFCNALSELAGLEPCYLLENGGVYRVGNQIPRCVTSAGGYRLPFSREWESAYRGSTKTSHYWGDTPDPKYAWFTTGKSTDLRVHPVAQLTPNEYGLYDMSGNISEWCSDTDRGELRVLRGGSVALDSVISGDFEALTLPEYSVYETGFRPASAASDAPDVDDLADRFPPTTEEKRTPQYPSREPRILAERLDRCVNDSEFGAAFHALIREKKYMPALELFRERLGECLSKLKRGDPLKAFQMDRAGAEKEYETLPPDAPFFGEEGTVKRVIPTEFLSFYRDFGDEKYLRRFFVLLDSLVFRQKAEYDAMEQRLLNVKQITYQAWIWFMGFDNSTQAGSVVDGLWALREIGRFSLLDPVLAARTALFLMDDSLSAMLKDQRFNVPNQRIHVLERLYLLGSAFPDFRISAYVTEYTRATIGKHFLTVLYPDGTSLEQAFNYNGSVVRDFLSLREKYPELRFSEETERTVRYLSRMLDSTRLPTGGLPGLGTCSCPVPPDLRDARKRKAWFSGLKPEPRIPWADRDAPAFQNVHFPYNGQSVLRTGFGTDDVYLFHYAPRKGSGHAAGNVNTLTFYAYGRALLINAGANSYGFPTFRCREQYDLYEELDRYQSETPGWNCVLVDGSGQSRLRLGDTCVAEKYPDTDGNRWYEDEFLVYTEGKYSDGYDADENVRHHREILWDRKDGLFFILDSMVSKKDHVYTQCWHLPPQIEHPADPQHAPVEGFSPEDRHVDPKLGRFWTSEPGRPNLFLYTVCPDGPEYTFPCGQLGPAAGWYSPTIPGRRYPKQDVRVHWKGGPGTGVCLTVLTASPDETDPIAFWSTPAEGSVLGCELLMRSGRSVSFRFDPAGGRRVEYGDGCRAVLSTVEETVVLDTARAFCVSADGERKTFSAPIGFSWAEKKGKSVPVYAYAEKEEPLR